MKHDVYMKRDCSSNNKIVLQGFQGVIANRVNPIDLAGKLNKIEFEDILIWMQKFTFELIKWSIAGATPLWPPEALKHSPSKRILP